MKDNYSYPAILEFNKEQEISVLFPDLDVATSGIDEKDTLNSAQELLELVIYGLEKDKEPIPSPSELKEIEHKDNQKVVLIEIFMPSVRNKVIDLSIN